MLLVVPLDEVPTIAAALRIGSLAIHEYPHHYTAGVAINGGRRKAETAMRASAELEAEARRIVARREDQHRRKAKAAAREAKRLRSA